MTLQYGFEFILALAIFVYIVNSIISSVVDFFFGTKKKPDGIDLEYARGFYDGWHYQSELFIADSKTYAGESPRLVIEQGRLLALKSEIIPEAFKPYTESYKRGFTDGCAIILDAKRSEIIYRISAAERIPQIELLTYKLSVSALLLIFVFIMIFVREMYMLTITSRKAYVRAFWAFAAFMMIPIIIFFYVLDLHI